MKQKKDDELDLLEEGIRKLKNKYDQFFAGIAKVPPSNDRRNVEIMIYELGKQRMRDNARRFRYNTMLSRYNQFRELWGRRMREREEGPLDFRRRQAALEGGEPSPPSPPERAPGSVVTAGVTSGNGDPYVKVASASDGEEIRKLYEQIKEEHLKLGKMTPVTIEQLNQMVQKQGEAVRSKYNVNAVAFRVETVDGKVKLKAKPLQE